MKDETAPTTGAVARVAAAQLVSQLRRAPTQRLDGAITGFSGVLEADEVQRLSADPRVAVVAEDVPVILTATRFAVSEGQVTRS
jgi:hypothetical protein